MSSCSLVNKTWNTLARRVIRNHRKCAPKNDWTNTACRFLQRVDQLYGQSQIAEEGRVVPFNSFKLGFYQKCRPCDRIFYNNLTSSNEIKLKHLEIFSRGEDIQVDCGYHKPLRVLLERKGHELRSLKIDNIHFLEYLRLTAQGWSPHFPQLESFDITWVRFPEQERPGSLNKFPIQWLLKNAPNLKTIAIKSASTLRIVPEEVLDRVDLKLNDDFKIQLWGRSGG